MSKQGTMDYTALREKLEAANGASQLYGRIVNAPFDFPVGTAYLFLGFVSLFLTDEPHQEIMLAAVSDTELYRMSTDGYGFDPERFRVPMHDTQNSIAQAIIDGKPVRTHDWATLSRAEDSSETARLNQASGGITESVVRPLTGSIRGAVMYNFYQYREDMGPPQQEFMDEYTKIVDELLASRQQYMIASF